MSAAFAAVFGTSRLISAYTGPCLDILVSGAKRSVGFSGNGLDTSGIGNGLYPIQTWYDQSGRGRHLTPGTASVPKLLIRTGALPCIIFLENDFLNLPSALSADRANSAVFHAARYTWQSRAVDVINWGTGTTSAMRFGSFVDGGHTPSMQVISGGMTSFPSSTRFLSTCTPCLTAYNSRAGSLTIRRDGYVESLNALSPLLLSGGRIGASGNATSYGRQDMFALVIYASGLTTSEELSVAQAIKAIYNLNSWKPDKHIVILGDSKTQGDAAASNLNITRVLHDLYGKSPDVWIRNMGMNGSDIASRYATFWFTYGRPYNYVEPDCNKNAFVCWLGVNDVSLGQTADQILANYVKLFNVPSDKGTSVTTQGWKGRVLSTIMPARPQNAAKDSVRRAVNAAIKTVANVNAIWDVSSLCDTGGVLAGFTTDVTLSQDGTHESEKAYALEGPSLKAAIDASLA
ncbi:hypothetical protein MMA231_04131 (plasmid) [Asticcacaulis sp. MM231]|uniref:SGNH/GDSL hydrolase family protein n=1 Tax=Asticcacaulis sp. MM231 TaxID=3157666 RepID=UPI0032D5ACA8